MTDTPLNGFGVLVTRPAAQSVELIDAIEANGGTAIRFPVIEIVPRTDAAIRAQVAGQPCADIAIFASRNAVRFGQQHIEAAAIAAIGPSTARALRDASRNVTIEPQSGFDSESLLSHPALRDVADKHIQIVRGGDGRELLATTLRNRGAQVSYLSVYDREQPAVSEQQRVDVESAWRKGEIGAITVMSVATLHNLATLLPEWCESRLNAIPLVTPAARVIKEALDLYPASTPILASGPQAADMLQAIISIYRTATGHAT